MFLPYLSHDGLIFIHFCCGEGLVACVGGEFLTSLFDGQLAKILIIHLCNNFWVSHWEIRLNGVQGMVILFEKKIQLILVKLFSR